MKLFNSYLEDEVREGYFVPSIMKRAWAAELEVLSEVDKLCRRHGITYFAHWGTLLGAVRHHGFIPWDDDIDISMLRKDFEHFLQVKDELPADYDVINYKAHQNCWNFLANVVAKPQICFEEEHLKKYNGFPYIAGIDIFILDYIAADLEEEKLRQTAAKYVLAAADAIGTPDMQGDNLRDHISRIEELCHVTIDYRQEEATLKMQLYQLVEALFAMFKENESQMVAEMMPYGIEGRLWMPKDWFLECTYLPFENTFVPVPAEYHNVLCEQYGDYMRPVLSSASHQYPFFHKSRKQLEEVLDFEIPGFRFKEEMMNRQKPKREGSLKYIANETQQEFKKVLIGLQENFISENMEDMLIHTQQSAIELGTLIEDAKGSGLKTISYLEQYCELVYEIYEALGTGKADVAVLAGRMEELLGYISDSLYLEVTGRKEIVFLPYKASHWNTLEEVYEKFAADMNCDVYVIPIPYYDKDYLGNFTQIHDESKMFPSHIPVTSYQSFDFALHCPDCIIIQNPYDEYNLAVSVENCFYSRVLQDYTECLIYIPYFVLNEFHKEDRAYSLMQYYCNVPGLAYADKVYVQSANMQKLYIEKLVEYTGEKTRKIWEGKIFSKDN